MNRGDVYWHTFRAPAKRRPVVVITQDRAIGHLNAVVVAGITTHTRQVASQVLLGPEDNLPHVCAVNCHQLHTVPKKTLVQRLVALSPQRMKQIDAALEYALGLHTTE